MVWPEPVLDLEDFVYRGEKKQTQTRMELRSVLTIGIAHFVAFFAGSHRDQWYFFDSMADRYGDECVPRIEEVPDVTDLLLGSSRPFETIPPARTPAHRLLSDCYLCVYTPEPKSE